jgi:hypothetical protein
LIKPKKPIGYLYEDKKTKKTYNGNGKVKGKDKVNGGSTKTTTTFLYLCGKIVDNSAFSNHQNILEKTNWKNSIRDYLKNTLYLLRRGSLLSFTWL